MPYLSTRRLQLIEKKVLKYFALKRARKLCGSIDHTIDSFTERYRKNRSSV
ncbi:MAG: hypothetical protein ABIJ27_01945 [Candidatus Omnitrophota bacterium]